MKVLRPIVSLFFACLVLVSSTSFMVGIHYCGGQVKHVALFDKAAACEMEQQTPPCHRASTGSCCQDLSVIHNDEDFSGSAISIDWAPSLIADELASETLLAEIIPASQPTVSSVYHPPVLAMDRPVVHRVILI